MGVTRRRLIAATLSTPVVLRGRIAAADTITIRIGALKLIHSITPYFYEQFLPVGYTRGDHPFRKPDGWEVGCGYEIGGFRHVRDCRGDIGGRGT